MTILWIGDDAKATNELLDALLARRTSLKPDGGKTVNDCLGLTYYYLDVTDQENDDIVARFNVWQVENVAVYHQLVRSVVESHGFDICNAMAVFVVDWKRPWTFVESLNEWITSLDGCFATDATSDSQWITMKTKLKDSYVGLKRQFDNLDSTLGDIPSESIGHSVDGMLNRNLGIPIVIVGNTVNHPVNINDPFCNLIFYSCKAEHIVELEKNMKDQQLDYIQQSLRTIGLSCGAALINVSLHQPESVSNLRSYIFSRSLGTNVDALPSNPTTSSETIVSNSLGQNDCRFTLIPAASTGTQDLAGSTSSTSCYIKKVQVVDREKLFVPSGWDTWGRISVLNESFPCDVYSGLKQPDAKYESKAAKGLLGRLVPIYASNIRDNSFQVFTHCGA